MYIYPFFIPLLLARFCEAGPVIAIVAEVAGVVAGDVAVDAVAGSAVAEAFGMASNAVWYGQYVIVDGVLFWGSGIVAGATLGGSIAGGVVAVSDKNKSKSIMSSIESVERSSVSASKASVSAVESVSKASKSAVESVSKASKSASKSASKASKSASKSASKASKSASKSASKASKSASEAASKVLSVSKLLESIVESAQKTATHAPLQSEGRKSTNGPIAPATTPQPTTTPAPAATTGIGAPPGTPVSTLPPAQRPSEVPAGVPEYNFRMCQYDIIKMGTNNQSLVLEQPQPQSIRVDNVPSTCMVLSTVLLGNPDLGPHPVPMGSASLQWNNVDPKAINEIRQAFGQPPQ
ncbi:hypothetical protein LTR93_005692 [Exophiala xenobiotica]|nr:hypothetical protein LTR93_005692 [Exophiala xenobiotica]